MVAAAPGKLNLGLPHNVIGQFADPFDFQFDRVACLQEAPHFEAAAAAVCTLFGNRSGTRAEKFSRVKSLVLGNVSD
jgi:hypothetical protein